MAERGQLMIAMSQIFLGRGGGGGGWTNPYITDGLVAMWDGEWNAGGGVHDAAATTWKDVVGGVTAIDDGVNPALDFAANYAELNGTHRLLATLPDWDITKSCTIEVACKFNADGNTSAFRLSNHDQLDGPPSYYYAQASVRFSGYFLLASGTSNQWLWNNQTRHYCLSWDSSNGNTVNVYRNGELNATANLANHIYWGNRVTLGAGMGCFAGTGELYCVRLCSRALTAAEVAANYAIDKARFNLP